MWNAKMQLKRDDYLNILTIKTTTKINEQSEEVVLNIRK